MKFKIASILFLCLCIFLLAYYWGYRCGELNVKRQLYDQNIMSISSNIVFKDAIENQEVNEVKQLLIARIESEISDIALLYKEYNFTFAETARCAITRRVRKMSEQKELFLNKTQLVENSYPMDMVMNYLDTECLGEPSKDNWIK